MAMLEQVDRDGSPAEPPRQQETGWSLPLALEAGAFAARRADIVEDTVRLVLEVRPGERPLCPDFGCRIHALRSIATVSERHLAAALIEESLERWVPWLRIERVDVLEVGGSAIRLSLSRRGERRRMKIAWYGGGRQDEDPAERGEEAP